MVTRYLIEPACHCKTCRHGSCTTKVTLKPSSWSRAVTCVLGRGPAAPSAPSRRVRADWSRPGIKEALEPIMEKAMQQLSLKLVICAVASLFFTAASLQAATLRLLSPADHSFVEHEQIAVVASLEGGGVGRVKAVVNGKAYVKEVPEGDGIRTVCFGVTLASGLNRITVTAVGYSGGAGPGELSVFLRSKLSLAKQLPPPGFERYYFHLPAGEAACAACHRMEADLNDLYPGKPEDSPCYQCHQRKGKGAYRHKPVSAGACFSCHQVVPGKRKYSIQKPEQTSCFLCHGTKQRLWDDKRVHHGPTALGNCSLCHDPHGSEWPSLTKRHPTELCLSCHEDKKSGLHVIAGFFGKGHPMKADKNPLKPDRPFSCAGCHNPHAGDTMNLLNKDRKSSGYCQTCHDL